MKKFNFVLVGLFLLTQMSWAARIDMVGGLRDGMALGIQSKQPLNNKWFWRYGVEASTGEDLSFYNINPFILFAGVSVPVMQLGWSPTELGINLIAENGALTEFGGGLSLIMNNIYNNKALSLELGIDYVRYHAHLLAQVGYALAP